MFKIQSLAVLSVIIFLIHRPQVESAKILAVFGLPAGQYTFVAFLLNALNERGHQITVISSFPDNVELHGDIRKVTIIENQKLFDDLLKFSMDEYLTTFYDDLQTVFGRGATMVLNIIKNAQVQHILKTEKFDLVLLEVFMSETFFGLGEYLNVPMIGVSSVGTMRSIDNLVGNISPLSFIPNSFLQSSFDSSFPQRSLNVAFDLIDKISYRYLYLPQQREIYDEFFTNATLSFDKAFSNFSLVLLNQHFTLSFPRPYVPNMIEVAGLHINNDFEKLPSKLLNFINESPMGVIYVDFKYSLQILPLKSKYILFFLRKFEELNYKIIWNIADESLNNKSPNIMFTENISHLSVLAHPNVKLFINNGEVVSISEAIYYAKPMLGIPIFGDQHMNIKFAVKSGYGSGLKLQQLGGNNLKETILELLENPSYALKAAELSHRFPDQPFTPRDRAIYWIEYVLRHNGATHLRVNGRLLNFWQYNNIDVFLAFTAGFVIIVLCAWILLKLFYVLLYKSKKDLRIKWKRN